MCPEVHMTHYIQILYCAFFAIKSLYDHCEWNIFKLRQCVELNCNGWLSMWPIVLSPSSQWICYSKKGRFMKRQTLEWVENNSLYHFRLIFRYCCWLFARFFVSVGGRRRIKSGIKMATTLSTFFSFHHLGNLSFVISAHNKSRR